jgi:D-cysteine desulfhydrase family pyridoxal phosphate-dependent enzyme
MSKDLREKPSNLIEHIPRIRLANLPTPIIEMPRLSRELGGPRIYVKRDDLTSLVLGGNKVRKLEFLIADAMNQGCDTIITAGRSQSNHACMTAAAALQSGIHPVLLLFDDHPAMDVGNLLIDRLLGAECRFFLGREYGNVEMMIQKVADELRSEGKHPYIIPIGGASPIGCLGYIFGAREIKEQLISRGIHPDVIVHASSTGGTLAGLEIGRRLFELDVPIITMSVYRSADELARRVIQEAKETIAYLNSDLSLRQSDLSIYDQYIGPGYGIVTQEVVKTIQLFARAEGILLDPVYSAKAAWGLVDLIAQGIFKSNQTVLFIHTGGIPGLFAKSPELVQIISRHT